MTDATRLAGREDGERLADAESEQHRFPRISFPVHAACLAVVLVVLAMLLHRGDAIVSADEGAALAQSRIVATTGGWGLPIDPALDPEGRWPAFHLSERGDSQWFVFAKHPVHVELLRVTQALGGRRAVRLLPMVGVWGAAVGAAALAATLRRRSRTRSGRSAPDVAVLWAVGVGSPLLFDGFWVLAHSLAAASATVAVLAACEASSRRGRGRAVAVSIAALTTAATALLRSEGVLFGVALALAVFVGHLWTSRATGPQRASVISALTLGGTVGTAAVGAYVGETVLRRRVLGSAVSPFSVNDSTSWLSGRVAGVESSILRPAVGNPMMTILVTAGLIATLGCAWLVRSDRKSPRAAGASGAVAVACAAAIALSMPTMVPGLLPAWPLLGVGLVAADRRTWATSGRIIVGAVALVYVAMVVSIQYGAGGTGEWGGRYFHLAIPACSAVFVPSVWRFARDRWRIGGRALVVALVSLSLALSVAAVRFADAALAPSERLSARVAAVRREVGRDVVVITDDVTAGRFAWDQAVDARWLGVRSSSEIAEALKAVSSSGRSVALIIESDSGSDDVARLPTGWSVTRRWAVSEGRFREIVMVQK